MDCTPSRRLFLLGAGALGHAVLDSLAGDRSLRKAFAGVLAIDRRIPDWAAGKMPEGCSFKQVTLTEENVETVFSEVLKVSAGDVVLDLLITCDPVSLLEACMERGAHYLNAATDEWDGKVGFDSLAFEQGKLLKVQAKYNSRPGGAPTAFLEQGMNPGMVNIFAIKALALAAEASGIAWPRPEEFLSKDGNYDKPARAEVARRLGLTSIHSTDIDYHLSNNYTHHDKVMVSTWGPTSFWEECAMQAEWHAGTVGADEAAAVGIANGKCSPGLTAATLVAALNTDNGIVATTPDRQAFATWVKSYSGPEGYYTGMVVPHGENFSLGRSLTVWGSGTDDTSAVNTDSGSSGAASAAASQPRKAMWSPEVAFVYRPNNVMLESCFFYGCDGAANLDDLTPYLLHTKRDQLLGQETVGMLLRFDDACGACKYNWIWIGNTLGYKDPALSHPTHNATILQVAAGVLSAVHYMLAFPNEGICWPEEAAHTEFLIDKSLALLGRVDIMHGTEPLTGLPRTITSAGASVTLDLAAELDRAIKAVRGTTEPCKFAAAASCDDDICDRTGVRDQVSQAKAELVRA